MAPHFEHTEDYVIIIVYDQRNGRTVGELHSIIWDIIQREYHEEGVEPYKRNGVSYDRRYKVLINRGYLPFSKQLKGYPIGSNVKEMRTHNELIMF